MDLNFPKISQDGMICFAASRQNAQLHIGVDIEGASGNDAIFREAQEDINNYLEQDVASAVLTFDPRTESLSAKINLFVITFSFMKGGKKSVVIGSLNERIHQDQLEGFLTEANQILTELVAAQA